MKKITPCLVALFLASALAWAHAGAYALFHLETEKSIPLSEAVEALSRKKIILVGEYHNRMEHHLAQLAVIRALDNAGVPVAVGLEMFRRESQPVLDRWVRGDMDQKAFQKAYYENWNFPWPLYRPIFGYARQKGIPLVGVNVPAAITRKVARRGFGSLSPEEKKRLPDVACRVDEEYMAFIKRAYGAHAHGRMNFIYFCEAQLVWDKAMAVNALEYLEANPGRRLVLLCGTGHAWKKGIPAQINSRSNIPVAVILPWTEDRIEPGQITVRDADFILSHPSG
jgi:uncharacterized iron-regulated protein